MSADEHPPTDFEMRRAATSYWEDDPIPPNHPARLQAEARWGRWIAAHDEGVRTRAVLKYRRSNRRLVALLWVLIALNGTAAVLTMLSGS